MKPTDIRQGQTYYKVMALPNDHKGLTVCLDVLRVHNRPVWNNFVQCYMLHNTIRYPDGYSFTNSFALADFNLPENTYNLHRIFRTRKKAERYAQRMRALQLTRKERTKFEHLHKLHSRYERDHSPRSFRIGDSFFPFQVIAKPASVVNMNMFSV